MKVVLLTAANSIHSIRWANGLASRGLEVHLISVHSLECDIDQRIKFHLLPVKAPLGYLSSYIGLKKLLRDIKPDILNAHYATGYGLLARLSCFKPLLISVWGSDVYCYPQKSLFHRWLLRGNLKSATAIASTSRCMAHKIAETYRHSSVHITPFGIDENLFKPKKKKYHTEKIIIGTVKTLQHTYGIDILISAFAKVCSQINSPDLLKLEITGGGPDLNDLKSLAESLGIDSQVVFHGAVEHERVPDMLNRLDIYVALSRMESFGVAALEASACEKPVVVSDAEGLVEVTKDGVTGFIVSKNNIDEASEALLKLINDGELRKNMGIAGRQHVLENYTWERSLDIMVDTYKQVINSHL